MIRVENLNKRYPGTLALQDVSFRVDEGEVVGFLGPNGAGKSTTMRILTGFLPPTSGLVEIAGHDVFTESIRVRERIGYMPEDVPLYQDMRVNEYLQYRATLKGLVGKRRRIRIGEVVDLCGLEEVRRAMIGNLSKGYRQRVGLADALVHEPPLLILDEPTIGLDPNQIRQVRRLIRELGKKHTILLSTHILSEVEMVCDRVLIINRGRLVASDTPVNLVKRIRRAGGIRLEINPDQSAANPEEILEQLPGVRDVTEEQPNGTPLTGGWKRLRVRVEAERDMREDLFGLAAEKGWRLRELHLTQATLEDAFVELTNSEELSS